MSSTSKVQIGPPERIRPATEPAHGIYALTRRGIEALSLNDRELTKELIDDLATPEGIDEAIVQRAALSLIVCRKIEAWVEQEISRGVDPNKIPILKSWPAYNNSAMRALKLVKDSMPNAPEMKTVTDLVAGYEAGIAGTSPEPRRAPEMD